MATLTCPHCQFSRDVPDDKLPAGPQRISCPKCRETFSWSPAPEGDVPATDLVKISCPHCTFSSRVARQRLPVVAREIRCKQCGQTFIFDPANLPIEFELPERPAPTAPADEVEPDQPVTEAEAHPAPDEAPVIADGLPPVIDLFGRSWTYFKKRVWLLLGIYLVTILMTVIPTFGIGILVGVGAGIMGAPGPGTWSLMMIAAILAMVLMTWGMVAMVYATVDEKLGFSASFAAAKERLWDFLWVFGLLGFIVGGGFFLLVVPGLLFMTWFLFCQYILAAEGEGGMASLLKSREYVRGYFWNVLLRLTVLWVVALLLTLVLGWIPLIGNLLSLLLFPYTLIFQYLLYCDLRAAKGGDVSYSCSGNDKALWLGVPALGYLVIPVAFFAAGGPSMLAGLMLNSQMEQMGGNIDMQPQWTPPVVIEEKIGEEPPTPLASSRKQVRALIRNAQVPADPGGLSVGPAALHVDQFWDSGSAPHVWIRVRTTDFPNLPLVREQALRVSIDRVEDEDGLNRYDRSSMFEKEFFQRVSLPAGISTSEFPEGNRDVYLTSGTDEDEIRRIKGTLHLSLPAGIEVVELTPSMMGKEYTVAGHDIAFKRLEGPAVTLELADTDNLLRVVGYNASGQPLMESGSSWSEMNGVTSLTHSFQGEVFSVQLIVAAEMIRKDYPFELKTNR